MADTIRTTVAAAAILALVGTCLGQTALGDGTALDRNLQVGSGGRNTRVRDIDSTIRFNEAVISGAAGRGKSFHGNTAYSPSRDFSVSLPSNDLYTFRRDSSQSVLGGMGVRASDAIRYQFSASTGEALPSALAGGLGIVPRTFSSGIGPISSTASSSLRSTADYLTSQALRPTLVGYRADDNGSIYTATASPLLGVTWYPLEQNQGLSANLSANAPKAGQEPATLGGVPRPIGLSGLESTAAGLPSPVDMAGSKRDRLATSPGQATGAVPVRSESYTRVIDAFRESYSQRTGTQRTADPLAAEDPGAAWRTDLNRLRETLRSGDDRQLRDRSVPTRATPPAATPPAGADVPPASKPAEPMRIPGIDVDQMIAPPKKEGPKAEDFLSQQMVDILRNSGVRIDTLRPASPTLDQAAYAGHMQAGQQAIGDGRFFDAEDRFARAMSAMPSDPMAAVGRLHAQLGAGLYLSAANNFRSLIKNHPELATAKFNAALVPGEERAKTIAEQLRLEVTNAGTRLSRDSALLLGYLGRLRGDVAMQNEGLGAWKERIPADDTPELALHELLTKVWAE